MEDGITEKNQRIIDIEGEKSGKEDAIHDLYLEVDNMKSEITKLKMDIEVDNIVR